MADAMDSMSKSMAEPEIELSDSLSYLTRRSLSGAAEEEEEEEEEEENEPEEDKNRVCFIFGLGPLYIKITIIPLCLHWSREVPYLKL